MGVSEHSLINSVVHAWLYGNLINGVTGQIWAPTAAHPPSLCQG